jgi:hypothetical protein
MLCLWRIPLFKRVLLEGLVPTGVSSHWEVVGSWGH